jgi:hypothetical protein
VANFQLITKERHASQFRRPLDSFAFAAKECLVPIGKQELSSAVLAYPVALVEQSAGLVPVAVLGLFDRQNAYVDQNGRWLGGYIPASIRLYPFRLSETAEGQLSLCIDEDSGALCSNSDAEPLFLEDGTASPQLLEVAKMLQELTQGQRVLQLASQALKAHGLVMPLAISLDLDSGKHEVNGLFQIDEAKLNALPAEALLALRDAGALALAYCMCLSMQHLQGLGQRVRAAQALPAHNASSLVDKDGTFSFAYL